jgi:hypothetical protein
VAVTQEERTALALAALTEVTDPDDVGELLGVEEVEPGVVDLRFACRLGAYAGWHWTVSTSDLPDAEVTVLEVELLPGDGALLAPPWVPWTERLADWRRQHPDEEHPGEQADGLEEGAELDDDSEVDEDDLAVDDELDELDETELEGALGSAGSGQDDDDDESDDDESDDDESDDDESQDDDEGDDDEDDADADGDDLDDDDAVRGPRPAEVDRSL